MIRFLVRKNPFYLKEYVMARHRDNIIYRYRIRKNRLTEKSCPYALDVPWLCFSRSEILVKFLYISIVSGTLLQEFYFVQWIY